MQLKTENSLFLTAFLLFNFFFVSHAQTNQWTWVNGFGTLPAWGTQGVPGAGFPGPKYEAAEWTDLKGNFWLYGGLSGNDLWKYDPSSNQWTWIGGTNPFSGYATYGTQGMPASGNDPGRRGFANFTWTDTSGNLWLYGGLISYAGNRIVGDLWKYDPNPSSATYNQWAWMKGKQYASGDVAVYGTQGVSDPANTPGPRYEGSCTWVDKNGKLWLYGGQGVTTADPYYHGDLWMYDPRTNNWTWVSGDKGLNLLGVYGTKGVAAPGNKPGCRSVYANWKDKDGNFWLFGGKAVDAVWAPVFLNDLWKFTLDPSSPDYLQWTWMNGDNYEGVAVYGIPCVEDDANKPGGRMETRAEWTDNCGNFWLYGGHLEHADGSLDVFSDLWKYNPSTNRWKWVSGDNVPNTVPVYGAMGVAAPGNKPGSKCGANSWKNKDGLWLWGGLTNTAGSSIDLWKYSNKPKADFTYSIINNCTVNFNNTSVMDCDKITSYLWNFGDTALGANDTSSLANPSHQFRHSGSYNVKLIAASKCFETVDSTSQTITVDLLADAGANATITFGESITLSATPFGGYSWSPPNSLSCSNCSSPEASPETTTTYYVLVTDANGCEDIDSVTINVFTPEKIYIPNSFTPNNDGINDLFYVYGSRVENINVKIFNRWGELVFTTTDIQKGWDGRYKNEPMPEDVYVYKIDYTLDNEDQEKTGRLILIK